MARCCPWRHAYWFDNALRRLFQKPELILAPYVREGMTVLDVGCGMGYFAIRAAELVGPGGKVITVDLQQEMLEVLMRRAKKRGGGENIFPHQCQVDRIGLEGPVDFAYASWMVHEVPDPDRLAAELHALLSPGGSFLIIEPKIHVRHAAFRNSIKVFGEAGFRETENPRVGLSHATLLTRD